MMELVNMSVLNATFMNTLDFSVYKTTNLIQIVISTVCQMVAVFGVVTNIINIICLGSQGFKDPINISLTGTKITLTLFY